MITSPDYAGVTCYLAHADGRPVAPGASTPNFRGDPVVVTGGRAPRKPGSTGHIWTADGREYFPGVIDASWRPVADLAVGGAQ